MNRQKIDVEEVQEQNMNNNGQTDFGSNQVLLKQSEKLKQQEQKIFNMSPDNMINPLRYFNWQIENLQEEYLKNLNYILQKLQQRGNNSKLPNNPLLIETISKAFKEILSISLLQKQIIWCFEYDQEKIKNKINSQWSLITLRNFLEVRQKELENLLDSFLSEIQNSYLSENFYMLSNKLGQEIVLSEFRRKWLENYIFV